MNFDFKSFMKNRLEQKVFTGLPLTIFIAVFLILLGTFIGITDSIVNSLPVVKLDVSFAHFLFLRRTPFFIQVFSFITNFASVTTIIILSVMAILYLYFKKELAYLYALLISIIGAEISVYFIKIFINRVRPGLDIAYYIEKSGSFPSGHSAAAIALFGFATYYLIHHTDKKTTKFILIFFGSLLIVLVGFSRLYLDVHFLSDVLGGFLIGGLWLVVGMIFRERHFYISSLKKGKNT